jgi:transformation/transcription domain-associated protein
MPVKTKFNNVGRQLIGRQYKFLESVRDYKTIQFLSAMAQLAHMDTGLAEHTWLQFFPQVSFDMNR